MERWFILMGIKYANSLGLSKGLLDSELISQSPAQFAKKNGNNCCFFIKQLKRGNQVYLVRKGFLFVNVLLIIRSFASMLVITVHGRGWDKVVFEGGWVEGFLIEEILLPPTLRDLQISVFQWVAFQETQHILQLTKDD